MDTRRAPLFRRPLRSSGDLMEEPHENGLASLSRGDLIAIVRDNRLAAERARRNLSLAVILLGGGKIEEAKKQFFTLAEELDLIQGF